MKMPAVSSNGTSIVMVCTAILNIYKFDNKFSYFHQVVARTRKAKMIVCLKIEKTDSILNVTP